MSNFKRYEVTALAWKTGLIPIFSFDQIDTCERIIDACYQGGVRLVEFTNRVRNAREVFIHLREYISDKYPDVVLGVGSIVDPSTAALFIQAGADFVVCPILNPAVIEVCHRQNISCMPGCTSSSEISRAEGSGVDLVKLFPAHALGPGFVKRHLAPCPWSSLMPTGGVEPTRKSLQSWFEAGVHCVGIGGQLFTPEIIESANWSKLKETVADLVTWIQEFRDVGQ